MFALVFVLLTIIERFNIILRAKVVASSVSAICHRCFNTQHATVVKTTREMKVDLTRRQVKKFHFPIVLLHIYKTLLLGRALHFSRLISLSIGLIYSLFFTADPNLNQDPASLRCCLYK